ncbi:MAG: oligopeptide/dipeptide ABC transporter ATP-binding protein [Trueperaceae bacterium]
MADAVPTKPLLEVRGLEKHFPITGGFFQREVGSVKAVDGVSFDVHEGEILSLVGESGCGKTTTARCVLRAIDPTGGEVWFRRADGEVVDVAKLNEQQLRPLWREMQMIFQDPFGSLNPRKNLLEIIGEPMYVQGVTNRQKRMDRVAELLNLVGLRPEYMHRFPHAFSGGQRQRVVIARALALEPRLVVADEAVSALDVSVQAQILNLLLDLQRRLNLSYLFVAHDLSIVKHISHRVAVMYVGKIAELAPTEALFLRPKHPYTSALMKSVPVADPDHRAALKGLPGEVANPADPPSGCYFHPRCPFAEERCRTETPHLRELEPGHFVSCHRAEELNLDGIGELEGVRPDKVGASAGPPPAEPVAGDAPGPDAVREPDPTPPDDPA